MKRSDISDDTPIFRYMELSHLIELLETCKFRLNLRGNFSDYLEKNLNLRHQFIIQNVGQTVSKDLNRQLFQRANDLANKSDKHRIFRQLPASCWTLNPLEDALMWRSYCSAYGIRIQSTVGKILQCPKQLESDMSYEHISWIYSAIEYTTDNIYRDAETNLFTKCSAYKHEEEFRFYLCRILDDSAIIPPILNSNNEMNYLELHVEPNIMLDNITFSPYFKKCVAEKFCEWIQNSYGIKAKPSNLICK